MNIKSVPRSAAAIKVRKTAPGSDLRPIEKQRKEAIDPAAVRSAPLDPHPKARARGKAAPLLPPVEATVPKAAPRRARAVKPAATAPFAPRPAPPLAVATPVAPAPKTAAAPQPLPAEPAEGQTLVDWERLARNLAQVVEEGGRAFAAMMAPRQGPSASPRTGAETNDLFKTFGQVAGYWMSDPARALQAQTALSSQFVELWSDTLMRMTGQPEKARPEPPAATADKRFVGAAWRTNPIFDFLRQTYLMTSDWAASLVEEAEELDPAIREKARFYLRQVTSALSPSNFLATNPELLRETFAEGGENLVRGMRMLTEDIAAGRGTLRIRQSDPSPFRLGVNMAATPGKVVFRNELMELIQYAPATAEVLRRPLLIVPPWINKFYVLDLNPEKSFIRWAVEQGLTVFVISWVNPDERHADKGFDAYMREGVFAALDAVLQATGERQVTTIGYCVGGTLLAVTLAYMAAKGDDRVTSSAFLTTQVDFRAAGDLKLFADEDNIKAIEEEMAAVGYLEGAKMAQAFNMLRPNELIWNYVVDNYIRGKSPMAFDLLVWNSDATRMPAANHAFYLRNCYLGNKLTRGEMEVGGERLDLGRVTIPVYHLATREDHIAPPGSVFTGAKFFGGPMRYVLSGSGHIAGVVNPPAKAKYQFWSGPAVTGTFDDWFKAASEMKGSWWPDWFAWVSAQAPEKVPARAPGGGKLAPLADAPGDYVRVRS